MVLEVPKMKRAMYFLASSISSAMLIMLLAVDALHLMTASIFGAGMLMLSMYRIKWENNKGSLQVFSVFSSLLFTVLMVCLSTVGLPLDLASVLLTTLSPQILVVMINCFDKGSRIQLGQFFQSINLKMLVQLTLTAGALFLTGAFMPQFLVWPELSFEFLCAPLLLILAVPDILYQNNRFNQKHTHTLSLVYGAMTMGSMLLLGLNAYTITLAASAVMGLFWNSKDTIEIKSRSWQSIAATSLFVPTGHLVPLVASCVFSMGSAKVVDLLVNEENENLSLKVL